jgi:hypothetical protein
MGLTVYYDWKIKAEAAQARRLIVKLRKLAAKLPFDKISPIYEQDPPEGKTRFRLYKDDLRQGDLYLSRKRAPASRRAHRPATPAAARR